MPMKQFPLRGVIALSCLLIHPCKSAGLSDHSGLVHDVNILQGTDSQFSFSHGNTLPLIGMPWGMVNWSIQNGGGGWFFSPNGTVDGFRATRQPSPWMGDYGQFVLMPQSGDPAIGPKERLSQYDTKTAVLHPDYARLDLKKDDITVELTGTERCGVFRLTYRKGNEGRLILDAFGKTDFGNSEIKVEGRSIHVISTANSDGVPKNFASHFLIQLDRDIIKSEIIPPLPPAPGSKPGSNDLTGYVEFKVTPGEPVIVKVASSFISRDQAQVTMKNEAWGTFDDVRSRVHAAWEANLGKVILGATEDQKRTFYSCLYRAQMFPHRLYELDAAGKPIHYSPYDGKIHDGVLYGDIGIWDGFRTTFPLISLLYPVQTGEILQGFVNAAKEGDGTLPEWPSPGARSCMIGHHCAAIFADALAKGLGGFDAKTAYESLKRSALEGSLDGMGDYRRLGYVTPQGSRYCVSCTLDYAYDDWCVARIAAILGDADVSKKLLARSQNYRNLWNPESGFMRAKDAQGKWIEPFDEFLWGGPYCESGAWQSSWFVPHDIPGLVGLHGGDGKFSAQLDRLFSLPPTYHYQPGGYGEEIHEMREMVPLQLGQCSLNNQPSFHLPYLYAAIGEPWKTQALTRRACATLFNDSTQGFPGDEDNGSMASWYILSAIGLYPFCPGSPEYIITSPLFESVTIHLPENKELRITTSGNSAGNVYIQKCLWNGHELQSVFLSHREIMNGGKLHFDMGAEPKKVKVTGGGLSSQSAGLDKLCLWSKADAAQSAK